MKKRRFNIYTRDHGATTDGVYAYLRVSTRHQAESHAGLDAQRDAIVKHLGGEPPQWFEDAGFSGSVGVDRRPGLRAMMLVIQKGARVVVAKRDRLSRDPVTMAMVESNLARGGATRESVAGEGTDDDTPTGRLMRSMIDAFAEYERLMIAWRSTAARNARKARMERYASHPPYGYYHKCGRILRHHNQQEVLAQMHLWRVAGKTWEWITDELNQRETPSPRGKVGGWHTTTIRNLVARDEPFPDRSLM